MSLRALITLALLLAACPGRAHEFGDGASGEATTTTTGATTLPGTSASTAPVSTAGPVTTGTDTTDTTTATSGADATTGDGTEAIFFITPDWHDGERECDPWVQDCPEGQKCMPYSGDGDNSWESLKCVDIVPDPDGLHEPCTAGPISTGEDSCDKGLMCWDVVDGVGQCVGMCIGTPDAPACEDPQAACLLSGVLILCLPGCDPLLQDCHGDDLCIPNPNNQNDWLCVLDASGEEGQAFDVCEYVNACDDGLLCLNPSLAVECDPQAIGCCLPICDLSLPNTCLGAGQECLPWYEPGEAPPGFENVGVCGLPMPSPFEQVFSDMSLRALIVPLLLAACGLRPYGFGDSATGTTTTGSASMMTDTSASTDAASSDGPDTGDPTTSPTTTGDQPITGGTSDVGVGTKECDHWMQDCPEGQKCMPYSGDDDPSWDGWKCVDIVPDPHGLYEDCMVFGSGVSGEDTCDNDLMCWDVDSDTGIGHCFGLCIGSVDTPHCADPTAYCVIASRGVLAICFPWCDPILQDCSATEVCIPHPQSPGFFCVLDASGDEGQVFDDCEYPNGCDPGLLCVDPTAAAECDPMAPGCCLPLCDTTAPNTCPGTGQECLPWYEPGEAPPDLGHVGLCALPMP